MDILVNNRESIAECEIIETSYLKCISSYANPKKTDIIKISGKKEPKLGTVYFNQELSNDKKELKPLSFTFDYDSKEASYSNNKLQFILNGKLGEDMAYKIFNNSYTEISILTYTTNKEQGTKTNIPCLTNEINKTKDSNAKLFCEAEINKDLNVKINIEGNKMSGYIKINSDEDIELKVGNEVNNTNTNKDNKKDNSCNNLLINKLFMMSLILLL